MPSNYKKSQYLALDLKLHDWAAWVQNDKEAGGSASQIYKMMTSGGLLGGGQATGLQCNEAELEEALLRWILKSEENKKKVRILRYEYDALSMGWTVDATQKDKAHRIGVSLRTYNNHVKACKDYLIKALDIK